MPPDPSSGCVIALQYRTGIDLACLDAAKSPEELVDRFEFRSDHVMVVITPGVARYSSGCGGLRRPIRLSLPVVQRQNNDRLRAGQHLLRIAPLVFTPLHVAHF